MIQLLEQTELQDYAAIATALSQELAASAVECDRQAGIPDVEIQRLREAGLLPLVVPQAYSGVGATWIEAFKIIQELAKADGSTGQLYGNHLILSAVGQVAGTPAQAERFYRATLKTICFGETPSTYGILGSKLSQKEITTG